MPQTTDLQQFLSNPTAYDDVRLQSQNITDAQAIQIGEALKKNNQIKILHLGQNQIGDEGAIALAAGIKNLTSLTQLYLYNNQIGDEGAIAVAAGIKNLTSLTVLHLSYNKIGDEGAINLAAGINLTSLTQLYLNNNQIGDEGAIAVAEGVIGLTSITRVDLYVNRIGIASISTIQEMNNSRTNKIDFINLSTGQTPQNANADVDELRKEMLSIIFKDDINDLKDWLSNSETNLNAKDKSGNTMLQNAALRNKFEMVKYLLEQGAEFEFAEQARENGGKSLFHIAGTLTDIGNILVSALVADMIYSNQEIDGEKFKFDAVSDANQYHIDLTKGSEIGRASRECLVDRLESAMVKNGTPEHMSRYIVDPNEYLESVLHGYSSSIKYSVQAITLQEDAAKLLFGKFAAADAKFDFSNQFHFGRIFANISQFLGMEDVFKLQALSKDFYNYFTPLYEALEMHDWSVISNYASAFSTSSGLELSKTSPQVTNLLEAFAAQPRDIQKRVATYDILSKDIWIKSLERLSDEELKDYILVKPIRFLSNLNDLMNSTLLSRDLFVKLVTQPVYLSKLTNDNIINMAVKNKIFAKHLIEQADAYLSGLSDSQMQEIKNTAYAVDFTNSDGEKISINPLSSNDDLLKLAMDNTFVARMLTEEDGRIYLNRLTPAQIKELAMRHDIVVKFLIVTDGRDYFDKLNGDEIKELAMHYDEVANFFKKPAGRIFLNKLDGAQLKDVLMEHNNLTEFLVSPQGRAYLNKLSSSEIKEIAIRYEEVAHFLTKNEGKMYVAKLNVPDIEEIAHEHKGFAHFVLNFSDIVMSASSFRYIADILNPDILSALSSLNNQSAAVSNEEEGRTHNNGYLDNNVIRDGHSSFDMSALMSNIDGVDNSQLSVSGFDAVLHD